MVDQSPDVRLVDDLVLFAQSQVEDLDLYDSGRISSFAAEAVGEETARLGLATFRGMGLIVGNIDGMGMPDEIAQDSSPVSDEDRFAVGLLVDQARGMVNATGEHSAAWVNSQASRAVAARTGELTVRIAKKLSRIEYIRPRPFVHSFHDVLFRAGITRQPEVQAQIDTQWNSDDLRQEATI